MSVRIKKPRKKEKKKNSGPDVLAHCLPMGGDGHAGCLFGGWE